MKTADFEVPGNPVPQGSLKAFAYRKKGWQKNPKKTPKLGVVMVHQNHKGIEDYRDRFQAVLPKYHDDFFVDDTNIAYIVECIFYISKPQTKRWFPTVRGTGDVDKLLRAVLDALTYSDDKNPSGLFKDDSQVIRVIGTKLYTDEKAPQSKTKVRITKVLLSNAKAELEQFTDFAEAAFEEKA
jgi:Holliday junction resolvase RusA-like endonuclease